MRWLLLDEIISIEKGRKAQAVSRVPAGGYSAQILMIEMMAQTGALVLGAEKDFQEDLIFAKIDNAFFSPGFQPGDTLHIQARAESLRPEAAWFEGEVRMSQQKIANARFFLMNVGHLIQGRSTSITFHDEFMNHFQVRNKVVEPA